MTTKIKKMKSILWISCLLLAGIPFLQAQQVPMGMNYQAVAREATGEVMADVELEIQVSLFSEQESTAPVYEEQHKVKTNALGLFSIVIGQGEETVGSFERVPWSAGEIWMEVALQNQARGYELISRSQMLSVPYALHAGTANEVVSSGDRGLSGSGTTTPTTWWKLGGNELTNPLRDKLGTTDGQDLVIVTTDQERIRVKSDGDVLVNHSLGVKENFSVDQNVILNVRGGETINNGPFTVENTSDTYLTGNLEVDERTKLNSSLEVAAQTYLHYTLDVDGQTHLGSTLEVENQATFHGPVTSEGQVQITDPENVTYIGTGALAVTGGVSIGQDLLVGGSIHAFSPIQFEDEVHILSDVESTDTDNGALTVAGGVGIGKNLNVGGRLGVSTYATEFAAAIENTAEEGDGLVIKLGKTHPAWNGSAYLHVTEILPEYYNGARDIVNGWFNGQPFYVDQLGELTPIPILAGTACNLFNLLTSAISEAVDLPIDPLDCAPDQIPSYTLPVLSLTDVANSLNSENNFISFQDKEGRVLGSIQAESVSEWTNRYLSAQYVVDIAGEIVGIDLVGAFFGGLSEIINISSSYNEIGVVYTSGHGDYAEWLERRDHSEMIHGGDIVGVKSGMITKNLEAAEQVMAVSTKPIVLGNSPSKAEQANGNTIAFVGQIPVKIMGPVQTGDFILGHPETPGYGIARQPDLITPEELKLVVGRAWETRLSAGPKMVNTLVGIDNGYMAIMLQKQQARLQLVDDRLAMIEARLDMVNANKNGSQGEPTKQVSPK